MPVTEHVIGQLGTSRYFSKLDVNSGYCQFELAEESQLLTTFITPFGRYKFSKTAFWYIICARVFPEEDVSSLVRIGRSSL